MMNFLKPLFFAKYKPKKIFKYDDKWIDLSSTHRNKRFSIIAKPTEAKEVKGTIILAHPMIDLGKYFFIQYNHANLYCNEGYNVVLFDFNGFGESDDVGMNFKNDVIKAIEIVKNTYTQTKIGLHGVSFGASQIILGAIPKEKQIKGLVVESAVSSNIDYYKGRGSRLYHLLNAFNAFFPNQNKHNIYYEMIGHLKQSPILFIYGKKDVKTPVWMGKRLYDAATVKKEFVLFNTNHLTTIQEEPEAYKNALFTFWDSALASS